MAIHERRVTVLIVEEALSFGGSIISTAALVRSIDSRRFRVVVAIAADKELLTEKIRDGGGDLEVIQARPLMNYERMHRLRRSLKSIRSDGLRKTFLALSALIQLVGNIPWMIRIGWTAVSRDVDIIQFNNGFGKAELTLVTRALYRIPIVFFRGYTRMGTIERWLLLPRLRACVSVSDHVKQQAIEDGVDASIVIVATPPALPDNSEISTSRSEVRRRYGIGEETPVIAIFGRVITWKGQFEFLKAGAEVIKILPDTVLLVVGGDSGSKYMKRLTDFMDEAGISDRVVFTGFVNDVDAHYRAADVIAHASIDPEPSGRVIFEAMSNEVPLVASSLGGPKEFIDDGETGFVVDPRNTALFAERMVTLLRYPELRKAIAARAAKKLKSHYGADSYSRAVESAYELVLGDRRR